MAGMLPGVECARRRRLHQSRGLSESPATHGHGSTRRPAFCLYTSNRGPQFLSSSSSMVRSPNINYGYEDDEKLGGLAREAKERLDERLRTQRKFVTKGNKQQERMKYVETRTMASRDLQTEVFGLKKSGSRRFGWGKLAWKATEQDECAICLDHFNPGEYLMSLPCAHRFHSMCLVPWLECNTHCPCCRMEIPKLETASHS